MSIRKNMYENLNKRKNEYIINQIAIEYLYFQAGDFEINETVVLYNLI